MTQEKTLTPVQKRSVVQPPTYEETPRSALYLTIASFADDIEPWGQNVYYRDQQLRQFWPTEPVLASAIYSIVARNAAFSWSLEGPPRTVKALQQMFHQANWGKGWLDFIIKVTVDLFTQDNAAFVELIHRTSSASSPVIGFAHLDASRCRRTGVQEWPVVYRDRKGAEHKMAPHQIMTLEEFPSPIETMNDVQLCAVSRVLRAAQLLRDISIHKREKVAGTNPKAIHLVSGIKSQEITDAMDVHRDRQGQMGFMRYMKPLILSTLDPTATVSHVQVDIAALPDGFDEETTMRWYINNLAMGFGADYQDFAPLPGRGLGTSAQSLVLHMKSRGKGPALFMKMMEHKFNFHGVIPNNVTFRYDEQDVAEDMEQANLEKLRAETEKIYIDSGILDAEASRQRMLDNGDLDQETFDRLQEEPDATPDVTAEDEERLQQEKQAEGRADFMEEEHIAVEESMAADLGRALQETFGDLKKFILGAKAIGFKKDPANLPENMEFWNNFRVRMVGAMLPYVRGGVLDVAQFNAGLGLAVDMDLINRQVLEFSSAYVNEWWAALEATTRDNLQRAITAWQETGLGKRGLPDLVASLEPTFGKARAERIAVTEVTRIFDEGNKLAHLSAGIETEEWQTSKDGLVCEICEPLDGQRFPTNAGPRPVTDTHVRCRCARLPVENNRVIQ